MILQSLSTYYDRKARSSTSTLPPDGYSTERIHFALIIDQSGGIKQVFDLREVKGAKRIPRSINVPQGAKKSVNIAASFLWGNTSYVLGADDKGKAARTARCHKAFKELHRKLLSGLDDDAARAILRFLDSWDSSRATTLPYWEEMLKGNLVFQLDGERRYVHEREILRRAWMDHWKLSGATIQGRCLVSGEVAPIARLHPPIRGVKDAQPTGAALVSFNLDAFCSYGKSQNFNAPISESRAAAYTKALNFLLASRRNRIQLGDATTVFWTERDSPVVDFFGKIMDPTDTGGDDQRLATFLAAIREGKLPEDLDDSIRFFILGLSPNASRLSVRFWYTSTVADICHKLGQHFRDLAMVRSFDSDPEYPGMLQLLRETANKKSDDGPPPLLAGAVMRSILSGTPYPRTLLSTVIGRIRAEQSARGSNDKPKPNVNYMRAAIIRAVLVRQKRLLNRGMEVSMGLDKDNKNDAYLLGRLFAVLECAQKDAIRGANATIRDRYYSSASATPRAVFPQLLRLAQHHISKAKYGRHRDKQIEEIVGDIPEFPAHLSLEQQGLFAIGYYHQRQDFNKRRDKDTPVEAKED
ncbi:MAG: type I-C CRISPR-associated protein Cas8c/Csd1 [Candidatus Zixiibacteriota bacterium]